MPDSLHLQPQGAIPKPTPPKSNIDTTNDGLENVSPFKHGNFGYLCWISGGLMSPEKHVTLPETNGKHTCQEARPQKETIVSSCNHPFSGSKMLVSGRVQGS